MNWYIGQEIVAVRDHLQNAFKKNDSFKIIGLKEGYCKCNGSILIDIGIPSGGKEATCGICPANAPDISKSWWFKEGNFAPLDTLCNISELTEILETTKPYEV